MSFSSYVGFRYLRARKSSAFLSTISIISILGVAVGVAALIVVLAVISGYEQDLRDKLIGAQSHGNVLKVTYGFEEYRDILKRVEKVEGVLAVTPFILREVMISSQKNISGALFKGIDLETVGSVTKLPKQIEKGKLSYLLDEELLLQDTKKAIKQKIDKGELDRSFYTRTKKRYGDKKLPGIVIGREMAKHLGVGIGDEINVVNPLGGGMGPTGPIPKNQYFRVAAIFYVGMFEYDMKFAFTSIPIMQEFSNMGDDITAIEFSVDSEQIYNTAAIGARITDELGGFPFKVRDWMDMNSNLFAALKLQRIAMFIILAIITLVAAFGIASTLFMMVIEKEKEIAILKSMGASKPAIMRIFILGGLVIGSIGTAIGLASGFLLCALIPHIGYELDAEIYYMSKLSVNIVPLQVGATIITALAISFVATLYPSWRAAGLKPVDGLRMD